MQDCKRQFERLNFPLSVSFRPTYGATDYTVGMMKNISCNGLSLEAENFSFIKYENLQLNLKFPTHSNVLSLEGSVVWKKQSGSKSLAGVKLKNITSENEAELTEGISSIGNNPAERIQASQQDEIMRTGHPDEIQKLSIRKRKKRPSKKMVRD